MFLIAQKVLGSLYFRRVNGNTIENSFRGQTLTLKFETISKFFQHEPGVYNSNKFTLSNMRWDSKDVSTDSFGFCEVISAQYNTTCYHRLEPPEVFDTLAQTDIVRKQYMELPYPAVSYSKLQHEKMYYNDKYQSPKTPYRIISSLTFEAINHFLYNGKNTFRLIYK